jgi:hypothetical protein
MRAIGADGSISSGSSSTWAPVKRIGFVPNRQVGVNFRIEGYEPFSATYSSPGPGEQRVEHVTFTRISLASLHVRLIASDGTSIPQAAFGFFLQPPAGQPAPLSPIFSREANPSSTKKRTFSVNAGSKATLKLASRRPGNERGNMATSEWSV